MVGGGGRLRGQGRGKGWIWRKEGWIVIGRREWWDRDERWVCYEEVRVSRVEKEWDREEGMVG